MCTLGSETKPTINTTRIKNIYELRPEMRPGGSNQKTRQIVHFVTFGNAALLNIGRAKIKTVSIF